MKLKNQLPASFEVFYSVGLGAYKESQHKALLEIIRKKFAIMEEIRDRSQLIHLSGLLFKQFLIDEHLTNDSLVIITENSDALIDEFPEGIVKWRFTKQDPASENEIKVASVEAYKGLEADMVIYIHSGSVSNNMNYIAHTRAKYYLIEFIRR